MKRFSIPPREERERHSHTMSAYSLNDHKGADKTIYYQINENYSIS